MNDELQQVYSENVDASNDGLERENDEIQEDTTSMEEKLIALEGLTINNIRN